MAVYTCAEMVAECLAGQPDAWKHFVSDYLPFGAGVLHRHCPQDAATRELTLRRVLLRARDEDSRFLREYRGHSEREFLLHLREHTLQVAGESGPPLSPPEIPLDWELFEKAFSSLTALERQILWTFVLQPDSSDAALLIRTDDNTVRAATAKAQELLRGVCDRCNPEMLPANRHLLAQAARMQPAQDCGDPRVFVRLLDGQITWRDREDLERHLTRCWRCVDHLCRFREVFYLSRRVQPFTEPQAQPYVELLGFTAARPPLWKRVLGRG